MLLCLLSTFKIYWANRIWKLLFVGLTNLMMSERLMTSTNFWRSKNHRQVGKWFWLMHLEWRVILITFSRQRWREWQGSGFNRLKVSSRFSGRHSAKERNSKCWILGQVVWQVSLAASCPAWLEITEGVLNARCLRTPNHRSNILSLIVLLIRPLRLFKMEN